MRDLGSRFLEAREQIAAMALNKEERQLLQQQRELSRAAGALQYQVINLLAEDRLEEAKHVLLRQAIPAQEQALTVIQEFAALQQSHKRAVIDLVAQPITLTDTGHQTGEQGSHQVSASIGIAFYPDDAETLDTLVRLADNAIYRVKRAGKGSYRYHQAPRPAATVETLPFQW